MATVLMIVTEITVSRVSRSLSSCFGKTAAMAKAAEAPQMATAPPVRIPCSRRKPSALERCAPATMAATTPDTVRTIGNHPRLAICDGNHRVRLFEFPSLRELGPLRGQPGIHGWLAFSPMGGGWLQRGEICAFASGTWSTRKSSRCSKATTKIRSL